MYNLLQTILDRLALNENVVVATIIGQQGSTPRSAGAKMVVFESGEFAGTIGGGLAEAKALKGALTVLSEKRPAIMSIDVTSEVVAGGDVMYGGSLQVFLDLVAPDDAGFFRDCLEAFAAGKHGAVITAIDLDGDKPSAIKRVLVHEACELSGSVGINSVTLEHALANVNAFPLQRIEDGENRILLVEPTIISKTVYIVGAGHVSVPTAHIAAMTGFRVVILDDREDLAGRDRFPEASEIRVIGDYDRFMSDLPINDDSFIIIVTRGHRYDKETLAQALETRAGYIGMIGSSRKRKAIYQALLEEGFTNQGLERVHSPIGLDIDAETPEEIAVSIVAEMIRERARLDKTGE